MPAGEKLAIAAHLHVLLRRKTGRVTDTQWMADNLDYAAEIVRFARSNAKENGHADLAEWADKLEQAMFPKPTQQPKEPRPSASTVMPALRSLVTTNAANVEASDSQFDSGRYVRGLR